MLPSFSFFICVYNAIYVQAIGLHQHGLLTLVQERANNDLLDDFQEKLLLSGRKSRGE